MDETDKAYSAGIIDGEGCIAIQTGRQTSGQPSYQPLIEVTTIDDVLAPYMQQQWGGWLLRRKASARLSARWMWGLTGHRNIIWFLQMIRPYLKLKGEQADVVIEFCTERIASGRKPVGQRYFTPEQLAMVVKLKSMHYGSTGTMGARNVARHMNGLDE